MTQPTPYVRDYSFTDFSSGSPSSQPPGVRLDAEYDGIAHTLDDVLHNLALIQRDDGGIANKSVGVDQLSASAISLMTAGTFAVRGAWLTATAYTAGDFFSDGNSAYLAMVDHTSTILANDVSSGKVVGPVFYPDTQQLVALTASLAAQSGAAMIGTVGGATLAARLVTLDNGLATLNAALVGADGAAGIGFIQPGTGAQAGTVRGQLRKIVHQSDFDTFAHAQTVANNNLPFIASPQTNTAFTGARTRPHLVTGGLVICESGDFTTDPDAFVHILWDTVNHNIEQEWRGASGTMRYYRTTVDDLVYGWDVIVFSSSVVVTPENTQNIIGNMKANVAELHYQTPTSGSYTFLTNHNYQATTEVQAGNTLTQWYGLIVTSPYGGGAMTEGYGVRVQAIGATGVTVTTPAAVKLDGKGNYGRIKWGAIHVTEDAGGKLELALDSKAIVLSGARTRVAAGTVAGQTAIIIGGVEYWVDYNTAA